MSTTRASQKRTRRIYAAVIDEQGKDCPAEREIIIDPQESEARTLINELAVRFAGTVKHYVEEGKQTKEQTWEQAEGLAEHDRRVIEGTPHGALDWRHLSSLSHVDMQAALDLWHAIRQTARDAVESGAHVTEVVCPNATPIERAQLFALREQLIEGWKPQNGMERAMIDMLALSFSLYLHWTGIAHDRVLRTAEEVKVSKSESPMWSEGRWRFPTISESAAVDQAHRLADGYHRQFMRTLRQLRDLRRYAPPVIVNNGGQVNVASQQVNVAK